MKVSFYLNYHSCWGEQLFIAGSCAALGGGNENAAIAMHYHNSNTWSVEISLPHSVKEINYYYLIAYANGMRATEDRSFSRHVLFDRHGGHDDSYCIYDDWFSTPKNKAFYSSAFTKNLFARPVQKDSVYHNTVSVNKNNMTIRLRAPEIEPAQQVGIVGNQPCLGNWNPDHALLLSDVKFPLWEIQLNVAEISFPLEYKFIVSNRQTKQVCYWEQGENRIINRLWQTDNHCILIDNFQFRMPELKWKACGTVIPIFSLRSEDSFGIGDIGDIKKLIDWAKKTNQHVIQVLPMNDTTRTHTRQDSYPYSAISVYALHPLYLNIPMLGELNDKKRKTYYQNKQKELNAKETVDYESVETCKTAFYRDYFEQEKDTVLKDSDFQIFISQNKEWLLPYAAFSYLRDKHHTADFTKWGEDTCYNREKTENFCVPSSEVYDEFTYLFFIQYTLHRQMETIFEYARENRVLLKGDIPIGVNRESVEAWLEPDYFNLQAQTGAPPDNFSETGQNWSFPTYNWEMIEKNDFAWWKKRFYKMQHYFDSFRIDHILGFFRIWEIPRDYVEGLCGHFRPALPLTVEEIENYGLKFDEQWITPRVHHKYMSELFGNDTDKVIHQYLNPHGREHYVLNETCATQRKIKQFFENKNDKKIRDGLMRIANEVLFLRDPYRPMCYHPRISACKSYIYRELSDNDKVAFNQLYDDFYFRRHNDFWKETALKRLQPLMKSTDMLVCGEDLGMIPATVHEVMNQLQIFSLEIERMPKDMRREFTDLTKIPYHAVCSTSTHDMNPLRAWWKENKATTQRYYNHILQREGTAPESCTSEVAEQIIRNHLHASSMLTIIPLQDWFAIDDKLKRTDADAERINNPANPNHYWCYRIHQSLETMLCSTDFNQKINNLITESGR